MKMYTPSVSTMSKEDFEEAQNELRMQEEAGVLDVGQEDYDLDSAMDRLANGSVFGVVGSTSRVRSDSGKAVGSSGGKVPDVTVRLGAVGGGCCFSTACRLAGACVSSEVKRVKDLDEQQLLLLSSMKNYKVVLTVYGLVDVRNHVELVSGTATNAKTRLNPVRGDSFWVVCTTMAHFFNKSNEWADHCFFESRSPGMGGMFGGDARPEAFPVPESVVDEAAPYGSSNLSGGVVRNKRRVIGAKSRFAHSVVSSVPKSYRTTNAIMFNNAQELFQDSISREYAQEIIEQLFLEWGVPTDDSDASKYAEDLLWMFLIASTASNKADYGKEVDIPIKPRQVGDEWVSSVVANFEVFSRLLQSKYGVTRRQFARGTADDMKAFLRHEENQSLLPVLATRVGCDDLMAYLAFDGSTHCTGMTTREIAFTKTLEQRNLFEREDEGAAGASDRLMQGVSGGVRSIAPR